MSMHRALSIPALTFLLIAGCGRTPPPGQVAVPISSAHSTSAEQPPITVTANEKPLDVPGIHNVIRVNDKLISGGVPEGDEGFESLRRMGVRTVISVDGARPEVDRARKAGLRYVHLPISYNGVPREQGLRLARAVRDLPGQVYIHCHHGKHRSPAAAAAIKRCLDGNCTAEDATAMLKQAGTGANYKGLYAVVNEFAAVSNEDLDRVSADFPESAPVGMFVELMVTVDTHWDHLKLIRAAGWKTPPKHPALDPAHEALLLREAYHESARLGDVKKRSEEMHEWLVESEKNAKQLEDILLAGKSSGKVDTEAAEKVYKLAATDCSKCHAKYRDVR